MSRRTVAIAVIGFAGLAACGVDRGSPFAWGSPATSQDRGPLRPLWPAPAALNAPSSAFQPSPNGIQWGDPINQPRPPPPISGGTLLVTRDGQTAVAADPDRDAVHIVDLATRAIRGRVDLASGDEPGRLAEDAAGRVHVALRRGGAVATIDLATGAVLARRSVCPAPRGLAYDPAHDALYVACAGGQLVTLPAGDGRPTRVLKLEPDLRDVVVDGDIVRVTTFRSPAVITLAPDGSRVARVVPARASSDEFVPRVAWRTVALPTVPGAVAMIHQRAQQTAIPVANTFYGTRTCDGTSVVQTTLSVFDPAAAAHAPVASAPIPNAVLPVDLAFAPDGQMFAVVAAGNAGTRALHQLFVGLRTPYQTSPCIPMPGARVGPGQAVAVAAAPGARFVVQTREPATLQVFAATTREGDPIVLARDAVHDAGHQVFHANAGDSIACASCHPEGDDDGHVWTFGGSGPRRTPGLRVGLRATAPFHWSGDLPSMGSLVAQVFTWRMNGGPLSEEHVDALESWLDALPHPTAMAPVDPEAAARGRALFEDPRVGCTGCHSGAHLTNNTTADVGTGGRFQVPSLIGVGRRAPYMHNGCAPTLRARFDDALCGGGGLHGDVSRLAFAEIDDLIAYLETL